MAPELSEQQIADLRKHLQNRLQNLREEVREELLKYDDEQYLELAGRVHDSEDESVADLLVDLNLAGINRHIRELREIDGALLRIARGLYGLCADCEAPIECPRLLAWPTAQRCHRCQEIYEKTHAHEGHASL